MYSKKLNQCIQNNGVNERRIKEEQKVDENSYYYSTLLCRKDYYMGLKRSIEKKIDRIKKLM